jgi:arsenical pump membrane protein
MPAPRPGFAGSSPSRSGSALVESTVSFIASLALLISVLAFAVARPWGLAEAWAAVPAAGVALLLGLVTPDAALDEIRKLGPTVGFLAAVLALAFLAGAHRVFDYVGLLATGISRGRPRRLLIAVFVAAALTTAALSLDATVVLLTPVVFTAAARLGARSRPHTYACAHLANSASLLLPVSNLTNLLAFAASGLTFLGFAAVMALPWLAVIAVEYVAFRWFFRADLAAPAHDPDPAETPDPPRYALIVLAVTLAGFTVAQPFGVHPAWVAVVGALALAVPLLRRRAVSGWTLVREANPAFCAFVFALGIVVLAVRGHGLGRVDALVPEQPSLLGLLGAAALAAVLANLLNNLPAVLVLLPAVESSPGLLLAVLIGVNVGPNLTYVGSLATLLWRQVLHMRDAAPSTREFLTLGALTVPAGLVTAVVALWFGLRVLS